MADSNDSAEKSHEPTPKKLEDARKKGEVARSTDLNTAAAYGGFLLAALALGPWSVSHVGAMFLGLIARADEVSELWFADNGTALSAGLLVPVALPVGAIFGLPAAAVMVSIIAQRAFVVAPEKIQPKFDRVSILKNAQNKFGRGGLFEFAKSFFKLAIYSLILFFYLFARLPEILSTAQLDPAQTLIALGRLGGEFLVIVLAVAVAVGAVDFLWQRAEHLRKNMMSRKEMMDEAKQSEGDPHFKQERRQRGYDIAMNKMLSDVPDADVVVVNPTHFAVALKWSRARGTAPECVAKGTDEIAARIREAAQIAGVPIHSDPPTARALFATVDIGSEIRPEHYQAVAAAIRFAETMRAKARRGWQ